MKQCNNEDKIQTSTYICTNIHVKYFRCSHRELTPKTQVSQTFHGESCFIILSLRRNVAICLAATWVLSAFSSIAMGMTFTSCTSLELLTRHAVIGACIITFSVLAVMSYIYIAVFLLSRRHRRQIAANRLQQQPTTTTTTTTTAAPTLRSLRAKMKTVFFSVIFCACVFLLWLPALVQVLYSSYTGVPADVTVAVFLRELFYSNSLVNPILYGLWHHDVRREVKRRLRQLCCKHSSCTTATPSHIHTRW